MIDGIMKKKFKECDLNDPFFDSLKEDYNEFEGWFRKKSDEDVHIINEKNSIEGFMYIKLNEDEEIELEDDKTIPSEPTRMKIGTFKTNDAIRGRRFGEGLLGIALKKWRDNKKSNSIYVTVFPKHKELIGMLKRYGFICYGEKKNGEGELVYMKSKDLLSYLDVYKSFPYIQKGKTGRVIIINEEYHDNLFPDNILMNTEHNHYPSDVRNGITKVFLTKAFKLKELNPGDFGLIYRKAEKNGGYKSVITGICSIVGVQAIKEYGKEVMSLNGLMEFVKNKTTLNEKELNDYYNSGSLYAITMLYCLPFNAGKHINQRTLVENNLWIKERGEYPYDKLYSYEDLKKILELSDRDEQDITFN